MNFGNHIKKMQILLERETINPDIFTQIKNRNHYLGGNVIYPILQGGEGYLETECKTLFPQIVNKFKRAFKSNDIDPTLFFNIKNKMGQILSEIVEIEQDNKEYLEALSAFILQKTFTTENYVKFEIQIGNADNILNEALNFNYQSNSKPKNYKELQNKNLSIYRQQLTYSIICGGANSAMKLFKLAEDELDSLDHRLYSLYEQYVAFNDFYLWVTPDNQLPQDSDVDDLNLKFNDDFLHVNVTASNFLTALYHGSKTLLSYLFKFEDSNQNIDHSNPWNTRVGMIIWNSLMQYIPDGNKLSIVLDQISQLSDVDFQLVFQELLSQTEYAQVIFKELHDAIP